VAATVILLAGIAAPAQASPVTVKKERLRAVLAKLDSIGMEVAKALERYDQAAARLETTQARVRRIAGS
jgi:hypothetical protein